MAPLTSISIGYPKRLLPYFILLQLLLHAPRLTSTKQGKPQHQSLCQLRSTIISSLSLSNVNISHLLPSPSPSITYHTPHPNCYSRLNCLFAPSYTRLRFTFNWFSLSERVPINDGRCHSSSPCYPATLERKSSTHEQHPTIITLFTADLNLVRQDPQLRAARIPPPFRNSSRPLYPSC